MMLDEHSAVMSVTVVDDEPVAQDVLIRAARSWHYHCQAAEHRGAGPGTARKAT